MPPPVAAVICILFILYLFWGERNNSKDHSAALWIPQVWMFLAGSRFVSQWVNLDAPSQADAYLEGSPVDAAVFLLLEMAAIIVLIRRRLDWKEWVRQNPWICLYFLFGGISVFWSAYPVVSFKRLFKAMGNVVMATVILTETRPYEAAGVVLRRLGLLLLPLSILLIKYYPQFGREYNPWTYEPMFRGVAEGKNGLGQLCLLTGIYFCWALLLRPQGHGSRAGQLNVIFLGMIVWLMYMADSATSLACLLLSALILLIARLPSFTQNPHRINAVVVSLVCLFGFLVNMNFGDSFAALLGRDATLTTRVPMWQGLREMAGDPLVGVGYESFWLGDRLSTLWASYGMLHQAHNGYLEVYLNLGVIGLVFIVGSIVSGFRKVRSHLSVDYTAAVLRLCFVVTTIIYNWTEATFYGVSNVWLLLFVGIMDIPEHVRAGERTRQRARFFLDRDIQTTALHKPSTRVTPTNADQRGKQIHAI